VEQAMKAGTVTSRVKLVQFVCDYQCVYGEAF